MLSNRKTGRIFVVSGPSGSGKSTLLKIILKKKEFLGNLVKIITVTTRGPRPSEIQGRDYRFISREEFFRLRRNKAFAESQEIFSQYYATPRKDLIRVIKSGKDALLCIDVKGALALKKIFPEDSVFIFIAAADLNSLKQRLSRRRTESPESLKKRLRIAREEISQSKDYDYMVVNDVLPEAVRKLACVITAERIRIKYKGRSNGRNIPRKTIG